MEFSHSLIEKRKHHIKIESMTFEYLCSHSVAHISKVAGENRSNVKPFTVSLLKFANIIGETSCQLHYYIKRLLVGSLNKTRNGSEVHFFLL